MAQELSKFEQNILYNIEKYGCSINHIFDNKSEKPEFSYSIGLFSNFKQPEIIIIGLSQELRHSIINDICYRYKQSELLKIGTYDSDILEGFDCLILEVDKVHYKEYLGSANWYYKGEDYPTVQIIYPTTKGIFPWEKDFPRGLEQPILNKNFKDFI
jgi:hypothetical protein